MIKDKILFIGNIQYGSTPTGGGVQVRNQYFLEFLQNNSNKVEFYDTWNKNQIISICQIIIKILKNKKSKIILSLSFNGVYPLTKILVLLKLKRNIFYWTVGGDVANLMKRTNYNIFNYYNNIIVQAEYIKNDLVLLGLNRTLVVPNFKPITYFPKNNKRQNQNIKFVFLSRLIKEKGIQLIIDAAKMIEKTNFEIVFYGKPTLDYDEKFFKNLNMPNIKYQGFLDLREKESLDILASYDVMLFPTFFSGEGFPGVLIDAFIAGLPVIASDFHANPEVIDDGIDGVLILANDKDDLAKAMTNFINGAYDLESMKIAAREKSKLYQIENILNKKLFKNLGIN